MLKSLKVPHQLLALSAMHRAAAGEMGAPLYLPAFQSQLRDAGQVLEDEAEFAAESFTLDPEDDDDDFY